MILITKVLHFETAHAILGYPGPCAHIHGHSYELQVTATTMKETNGLPEDTGMIMDFKDLKNLVQEAVIKHLDHKLILSDRYLASLVATFDHEDVLPFEAEPTAENLLIYIQRAIASAHPAGIRLARLKLWETPTFFAEWSAG